MGMSGTGVVTTRNWLMASDGERYLHFFCTHWEIITDKEVPIDNFHSRERWSLLAIADGKIVSMMPGCEVCGFISTDVCPEKTGIPPHKNDEPDMPPGIFNFETNRGYK